MIFVCMNIATSILIVGNKGRRIAKRFATLQTQNAAVVATFTATIFSSAAAGEHFFARATRRRRKRKSRPTVRRRRPFGCRLITQLERAFIKFLIDRYAARSPRLPHLRYVAMPSMFGECRRTSGVSPTRIVVSAILADGSHDVWTHDVRRGGDASLVYEP